MKKRRSGILMHISSLSGKYGIGDLGPAAYEFIDFLSQAGQDYWQILPLGITSYGDSPYQSFSAFAGNPYFIDLDPLIKAGYLDEEEVRQVDLGQNPKKIDYEKLYDNKMPLLRRAYENSKLQLKEQLDKFYQQEKEWLRDFALFMALKDNFDKKSWLEWPADYRDYKSKQVQAFEKENQEAIFFWVFSQYYFYQQWQKLKAYANKKEIKIMGDLPIYVAEDSCDLWSNPQLFKVDKNLQPRKVAGVPPDAFSDQGQLWGNPIYDWQAMEKDNYSWWVQRIRHSFELFDSLRIDHFRAFHSYWEIDWTADHAKEGVWQEGPGLKFFEKIHQALGPLDIIAEDLGIRSPELEAFVEASGFPSMKVLQFGLSPGLDSEHLPHNYSNNMVVYTGTHDNQPILDWLDQARDEEFAFAKDYLRINGQEGANWAFIRGIWSSVAYLAIAPMQDFLGLGEEARMNKPSSLGGNWQWRIGENQLTDKLAEKIKDLTDLYRP